VYNTVIVNRSTTINNITYVNQRTNGVTVVSHDAFVNARPVAQNIMKVEPREIASAPVTHIVRAEPVRTSVIGAGRPVAVRPPAAVISRPVVAVRTPPPLPRPIDQRQAQAGGHLNEQALVRPVGPAQPARMNPGARPTQTQDGFRPFTPGNSNNNQVRQMPQTQPRVYEQQGTPQPENRNAQPSQNRMAQPENRNQETYRPPQQEPSRPPVQETHPLVHPAPPVQERNQQQEQQQEEKFHQWQQTRPTPAPRPETRPSPPPHSSPPPKQEKPKGH
jgi:hypothetical protein